MRIFLGFDGVLRPEAAPRGELQPDNVQALEDVVLRYPGLRVVISSTWRLAQGLDALRALFSARFGQRIEGVTPDLVEEQEYPRHAEILAWLRARELSATPWIAIDHEPEQFPPSAALLLVDPAVGFDADCARRLDAWAARTARQEDAEAPDLDFSNPR